MKWTRFGSIGALVCTSAFTVACFVGPACGCSVTAPGTVPDDFEQWTEGAVDAGLEACVPRSWDLDLPIEAPSLLTILPHLSLVEGAELTLAITAGDREEIYTWVLGEEFTEPFEIEVLPGEAVSVSFGTTHDNTLDWEFVLDPELLADEALVVPFDDPEAALPLACDEASGT